MTWVRCSYCKTEVPREATWPSKTQDGVFWCREEDDCANRLKRFIKEDTERRSKEAA